jgi:type VI secretion system secreted protein Hcp
MATDFFLKLDGIEGESKDDKHGKEIQIESFSWGASQATSVAGGGLSAGKAQFQDFHFVMAVNKASPLLLQNCATGKHIPTAFVVARKAGDKPMEYLKIKFEDVLVSSYQTGGSAHGDIPMDQVSLVYGKMQFEYYEQDAKGQAAPKPVIASYDLKANKK